MAIWGVGYYILYVLRAKGELVIIFSTLLGLYGSWLLHSLLCEGYITVGHYIFYVLGAIGGSIITFYTLWGLHGS